MKSQVINRSLTARSGARATNHHVAAVPGHRACRRRATTTHAHTNWTQNYSIFSVSDNLDDAARRLRLKANQLAKKGPLSAGQSASLAAQRLQIDSQDALAAALQQMQAATADEQYEEAARLRDESLAWLEGWHKPVNSDSSRPSSLLYVKKEHSRWTGRWFTPGDFMHFDMQRSSSSSSANSSQSLEMSQLLQDPRYGTPLFEVFVLPADDAKTAASGLLRSNIVSVQSTIEEESNRCSSFTALVVALQSVQRAMNEILRVVPVRRPSSSSSQSQQPEVRVTNQRIMVLADISSGTVIAAAVHSGNDSTLLTWHTQLHSTADGQTQDSIPTTPAAAAAAEQVRIVGPQRPAESGGGALKVTFTLDWHELDLLRGPGSIHRTGASSFQFSRKPLPADIPASMCSSSSSSGASINSSSSSSGVSTDSRGSSDSSSNGSSGHSSDLRLYRVDLQYHTPVVQGAALSQGIPSSSSRSSSSSSSSSSTSNDSRDSSSSDDASPAWELRIAAELQQQLSQSTSEHESSSSSCNSSSAHGSGTCVQHVQQLASLLAAAATGTAPADAVVSESQQLAKLTEVALPGRVLRPAVELPAEQGSQPDGEDVVLKFEKVSGKSIEVCFGGWEVSGAWAKFLVKVKLGGWVGENGGMGEILDESVKVKIGGWVGENGCMGELQSENVVDKPNEPAGTHYYTVMYNWLSLPLKALKLVSQLMSQ